MISIPQYNQNDPRWKDIPIGLFGFTTPVTIGSHGCLITCESMRLAAFGLNDTPDVLVSKAKLKGALDIEGNFLWEGIERVYSNLAFLERRYTTNRTNPTADGSPKVQPQAAIERIKLLLLMGQPVPLEVFPPFGQHFILAVKWDDTRKDFICHDPNGGIQTWFKDRYGDPLSRLMGWILSIGPTAWFPDNSTPERQQMGLSLGFAQLAARNKDSKANALRSAESLLV
jgi:hypothetical protein